jgi:hypothetical protein
MGDPQSIPLISTGACVNDLEIIAKAAEPDNLINAVIFLPLK